MPKEKGRDPYEKPALVDDYAAPFRGGYFNDSGEVKGAGQYSDVTGASGHDRESGPKTKKGLD